MNTDLAVESAAAILEASPAEAAAQAPGAAAAQASHFEQAMTGGNPEVGGEGGGEGAAAEASTAETILADYHAATGQSKR